MFTSISCLQELASLTFAVLATSLRSFGAFEVPFAEQMKIYVALAADDSHETWTFSVMSMTYDWCVLLRHTEDMELHSLNYLHYGAPKIWYCVSPAHKKKMDAFVAGRLYAQHDRCKDFMRHKVKLKDLQLTLAFAHQAVEGLPWRVAVKAWHLLFFLSSAFLGCYSC